MYKIKNAIVYSVVMPPIETVAEQLALRPFAEALPHLTSSTGFIINENTNQLVTDFPGGFMFILRRDDKIIPTEVINRSFSARQKAWEANLDRKLTKDEKLSIKQTVVADLAVHAYSNTKLVHCFYLLKTGTLILDTTSNDLADTTLSVLVGTLGKLETKTLHVSDLKHGLTTRLKAYTDEDDLDSMKAFGSLIVGTEVSMKRDEGNDEFTAKNVEVQISKEIREALNNGCQVTAMRLSDGAVDVRLTKDFKLQSMKWVDQPEREDEDQSRDEVHDYRIEIGRQACIVDGFTQTLLAMFDKEPAKAE